ncbi:alpha-amylase [Ornatilinea apprima]|uniref:Alpha-amylase n=1 Tax=Ornatilinea apprima TaxID=1134406 RepID=A0A0P6X588_9CHLR|nr:alpha-amylase family glycosyl hydrolase [Ornatilinea apprima]KPL77006.1 alpha-amylase [Ornatilinea apprima]
MNHWSYDAVFYHIYPLGLTGAPPRNDFASPSQPRLAALHGWLDHLQGLGVNALYLGPLFESSTHGYDSADYFHVDRRLGSDDTLRNLVNDCHARGMRVILDGVFNHTGRDFWAFRDVLHNRENSPYRDWFAGLRFNGNNPYGDGLRYDDWQGHASLVKLNLTNPRVVDHLLQAVESWIEQFDIDGLRLDAADCVDLGFQRALRAFTSQRRPDFWLMGEVVHGDYTRWANPQTLHAVTNYECYKGLYSSLNDQNYFEIAWSLNRQFGEQGLYGGLPLYNFVDNHDVNRAASVLKNPAHLYPLYLLLFTMPGVPSIYYGSEWGLSGEKTPSSDAALRPALPAPGEAAPPHPHLAKAISRLASLRHSSPALRRGDYQQLVVRHEQFAFLRSSPEESLVVALNAAQTPAEIEINLPAQPNGSLIDLLNPGERFPLRGGRAQMPLPAAWGRVLRVES